MALPLLNVSHVLMDFWQDTTMWWNDSALGLPLLRHRLLEAGLRLRAAPWRGDRHGSQGKAALLLQEFLYLDVEACSVLIGRRLAGVGIPLADLPRQLDALRGLVNSVPASWRSHPWCTLLAAWTTARRLHLPGWETCPCLWGCVGARDEAQHVYVCPKLWGWTAEGFGARLRGYRPQRAVEHLLERRDRAQALLVAATSRVYHNVINEVGRTRMRRTTEQTLRRTTVAAARSAAICL